MNSSVEIDRLISEWGQRVFNSGPVQRTKARRGMTGLRLLGPQAPAAKADAKTIRRTLRAIVKRTPQVLVKVSGGGKTIRHIIAHLDYISRNGQITVEDQNGDKLNGRADINALRNEWQFGGFPIPESSEVRQAFNIVLSMPAGTDEHAVLAAARDFARAEFEGFQYAMALHTFDTDPDQAPSPHPHVHLCVKATSLDGTRLNPRKADLQRWREVFAKSLREHGVEADATRRLHRLRKERGEKQSVRYMRARGEKLHSVGRSTATTEKIARARQSEIDMLRGMRNLAVALAKSVDPHDRSLAVGIAHRFTHIARDVQRGPEPMQER